MNPLYTQYVNEARTRQYQQALQQQAERTQALRTMQREQAEQLVGEPGPSYARRLVRALATLL
jgi:hypothetical protein